MRLSDRWSRSRRARRLEGQRGVTATEEDERGGRDGAGLDVPHAADHDLVVAAGQAVLHRAFQHGEHAVEPGTAGRPVPAPDPSQAAASPRRAKPADRCSCPAASTFTTDAPCPRMARSVRLPRSKQTRMSGGSSDSEVTALAVVPTGAPSAPIDVTTVTPVAKWPMASRNSVAGTSVPGTWLAAVMLRSARGWAAARRAAGPYVHSAISAHNSQVLRSI